tara:strand:- start:226 stop:375 length:150 start_codon:yes stop_codon:yes gene_type:complete
MIEWFIMTVKRFLFMIRYGRVLPPVDIFPARWYAMVKQYNNNKEAFENE